MISYKHFVIQTYRRETFYGHSFCNKKTYKLKFTSNFKKFFPVATCRKWVIKKSK